MNIELQKTQRSRTNKKTLPKKSNIILVSSGVSAGFPSPAEDYVEKVLDLNQLLISKPSSTFMAWVQGDSMIGAGIFDKDLLIIDKSIQPTHKSIVVAFLNGEFTLKRLVKKGSKVFLQPENPNYPTTEVTPEMDFRVWGVLKHSIRMSYSEKR